MAFENLITSTLAHSVLSDLHKRFSESRISLLRVRSERMRLARSGWRPHVPSETKLIRSAEWIVDRHGLGAENLEKKRETFDLYGKFIPTESDFFRISERLSDPSLSENVRLRLRGLELSEPRSIVQGRSGYAAFFDLVLTLSRNPHTLIGIPQIESYLEARFWSEVLHTLETGLSLPKHSIRVEVGIDSLSSVVEAEEIIFELKDVVESLRFDPRMVLFDELKLDSASPRASLPEMSFNRLHENLLVMCRKRGVRFISTPAVNPEAVISPFTLDALQTQVNFAYHFLREWFSGNPNYQEKQWEDFELARALIWTTIHSGFLRIENYEAWKEEFGPQPFESGSAEDAAIRTLDPLLETAQFPEYSMHSAFTTLLELEKTRSVTSLRLA